MRIAYDFHIHSSLSPCADNDMTPNNIVNMSLLKGLEAIAITDHNSCANLQSVLECAKDTPLLIIPGMELETSEEIHIVCLFPDIKSAHEMQRIVDSKLPNLRNRENIFGEQLLFDRKDELIGKEERLLLTSCAISINEVFYIVNHQLNGIAIPAHIDRQANSILSTFGVMPLDIAIQCVEISNKNTEDSLLCKDRNLYKMNRIYSSDAHYLGNINERHNYIDVDTCSVESVLKALRK